MGIRETSLYTSHVKKRILLNISPFHSIIHGSRKARSEGNALITPGRQIKERLAGALFRPPLQSKNIYNFLKTPSPTRSTKSAGERLDLFWRQLQKTAHLDFQLREPTCTLNLFPLLSNEHTWRDYRFRSQIGSKSLFPPVSVKREKSSFYRA